MYKLISCFFPPILKIILNKNVHRFFYDFCQLMEHNLQK